MLKQRTVIQYLAVQYDAGRKVKGKKNYGGRGKGNGRRAKRTKGKMGGKETKGSDG